MKDKHKHFIRYRVLYFALGMSLSFAFVVAQAAWNDTVNSGDTLTSVLWNDVVNKLIEVDNRLNAVETSIGSMSFTLDCYRSGGGHTMCNSSCASGYTMTGAVDYDGTCTDGAYIWCCRIQ